MRDWRWYADCGTTGSLHRDIKPANLLVKDGHLYIIDVAFAQVRPSPWREAVDLANMMLVLGVRTDAERVYRRALAYFTPDDIAEAFAAARGIASPSQLRTMMKKDGRDLLAQFRALAPARRPISLQTWGPRRIFMAAALVVIVALALMNMYNMFSPVELPIEDKPAVRHGKGDDRDGPGGAVGHLGAVRGGLARRMDGRRRQGWSWARAVLARLRSGGRTRRRCDAATGGRVRPPRNARSDQ